MDDTQEVGVYIPLMTLSEQSEICVSGRRGNIERGTNIYPN